MLSLLDVENFFSPTGCSDPGCYDMIVLIQGGEFEFEYPQLISLLKDWARVEPGYLAGQVSEKIEDYLSTR